MMRSPKIHILLLVLITIVIYADSLGGDFIYDDKPMITTYDFVKDVSNIPKAFVGYTSVYANSNYYRPLQTISNTTDYFLWGDFAPGFHLTNALFHVACVLLVYCFITVLFRNRIMSFITALLFSIHPIHTPVVSYIAGRADSMLCAFMMACFIFYLKFQYGARKKSYFVYSLFFFLLALLTKELAMIIPFALILLDIYERQWGALDKPKKLNMMNYLPFLAILGIYVLFRITKMSFFAEGAIPPFPLGMRLATVPYAIAQYFRLIIIPNDLHMERVPWLARSFLNERVVVSTIVVAAVFFAAYRLRHKERAVWFGICWFIVMIFPSLNIITPLFYTFAENWLYIPSIGLFLIIAALVIKIYEKLSASSLPGAKYAVITVFILSACVMGAITIRHNLTWRDEISAGLNTLKFNPRAFKVYNNIGVVYLGRGELDKAEEAFKRCLEIKPDTGMAYFNLYRIYIRRGQREKAVYFLNKARELDPQRISIITEKMGIKD